LPEVTNDMITRFMDVDMSMVVGDIASIPSRLGDKERPQLGSISGVLALPSAGKSPLGELDGKCATYLSYLTSCLTTDLGFTGPMKQLGITPDPPSLYSVS
jgi:hypothetical protein